jgi:fimbrial chaperone protein
MIVSTSFQRHLASRGGHRPGRAGRWLAGLSITCAGSLAGAANFEIAPVILELSPTRSTDSIRVVNRDQRPISIQVRSYDWLQVDGEDRLDASANVQISPPLFTLAPGASQTVRLLAKVANRNTETAYRLLIDQIPVPDDGLAINFKFRVSMPVFVAPAVNTEPRLTWQVIGGATPYVQVANGGNRRIKLNTLAVSTPYAQRIVPAMGAHSYILANSTRRFPFAADKPLTAQTPVTVSFATDAGAETLTLDSRDP